MDVILKEDVKHLGYKDDLVKVKNGYGLNFLIPKKLAIVGNETNKKVLAETIKQRSHKEEKIKKEAQTIADSLKDTVLSVGAKVGENGKIFGSVTTVQISDALKKKGHNIDRKQISFEEEAVKTIGTYSATINLHRDLKVKITFEVVGE
jgi:large subunit ribosomal protein L9